MQREVGDDLEVPFEPHQPLEPKRAPVTAALWQWMREGRCPWSPSARRLATPRGETANGRNSAR